ncbi:hypothetical protein HY388_00955 [Candidatus Daviesbacteria bacterium]|nr:hypothetical protein [Candidatus Daviesbacteria bacterium]
MKKIITSWKRIAEVIGNIQIMIIFSIFYLTLFTITGTVYRALADPFCQKKSPFWQKTTIKADSADEALRQG